MDGSSAKASAFAAIRLVVLVLFAAVWLTSEIRQANGTELVQSSAAVESYLSIPLRVATRLAIVSVAFGIVQYIAAWMRYLGQLRLTRAELAAEIRESEGDPVNRRRVRQHQLNRSHVRWEKLLRSGDLVLVGNGRRAVAVRVGADGRTVLIGKAIGTVSSLMERAAVVRGAAIVRNNALVTIAAMHGKVGGELPAQLVDSIARIRRDRSLDCVLGA
jgi:flagellar biosynthesis protein FlhB